jgi:hypothetical protein
MRGEHYDQLLLQGSSHSEQTLNDLALCGKAFTPGVKDKEYNNCFGMELHAFQVLLRILCVYNLSS